MPRTTKTSARISINTDKQSTIPTPKTKKRKRMPIKTIKTIDEYIDFILTQRHNQNDQFWDFDQPIWFRGQSKDYPLRPGFLHDSVFEARFGGPCPADPQQRDLIIGFERHFNKIAKRRTTAFSKANASIADLYFEMQHHGIPTRLLDWSENALVALFFAVTSQFNDDGFVYLLSPSDLLSKQDVTRDLFYIEHLEISAEIYDLFYHDFEQTIDMPTCDRKESKSKVLPVVSNLLPGRMLQQSSCFTFHTLESPSLADIPNFRITKVRIPADSKRKIQRRLRSIGIDYASIYCDMDNVGRELKEILLSPQIT